MAMERTNQEVTLLMQHWLIVKLTISTVNFIYWWWKLIPIRLVEVSEKSEPINVAILLWRIWISPFSSCTFDKFSMLLVFIFFYFAIFDMAKFEIRINSTRHFASFHHMANASISQFSLFGNYLREKLLAICPNIAK